MKLLVLSVVTHNNGYYPLLKYHLDKNNIQHKFLGFGQKWGGWDWRTKILEDELKRIDETKYTVAVIDGWDVVMFDDEKTVLEKYRQFEKEVVLSSNLLSNGKNLCTYIFKIANRNVNGGIYIGNPKIILELFKNVRDNYNSNHSKNYDDEVELNKFLSTQKGFDFLKKYISVDHNNTLIYTDNPLNYFHYNTKVYKVTSDGKINFNKFNPSFMHTPGYYNDEIIKNNNLNSEKKMMFSFDTKKLIDRGKHVFFLIFIMLLLILIVISFSN